MRYDQIVRSKSALNQHILRVEDLKIPDLWGTVGRMRKRKMRKADIANVEETWHLCHDLLKHVKRVCKEPHRE
jgi:hypothetical protein